MWLIVVTTTVLNLNICIQFGQLQIQSWISKAKYVIIGENNSKLKLKFIFIFILQIFYFLEKIKYFVEC